MSHTYAILEVSEAVYNEIATRLRAADYHQAFHAQSDGTVVIDMHGIALQALPGEVSDGAYRPIGQSQLDS